MTDPPREVSTSGGDLGEAGVQKLTRAVSD
jgi:hypothetical protein